VVTGSDVRSSGQGQMYAQLKRGGRASMHASAKEHDTGMSPLKTYEETSERSRGVGACAAQSARGYMITKRYTRLNKEGRSKSSVLKGKPGMNREQECSCLEQRVRESTGETGRRLNSCQGQRRL
jgi:hypothetical protein